MSDGVRTALIDKRQSSWVKEEMPNQDEINRLMGVTCYEMFKNPAVNNEKSRMAFRDELGDPTKVVHKFGMTVDQIRGHEKNSRAYRNRLQIVASRSAADATINVSSGSGSDSDVVIVKTARKKKKKRRSESPPHPHHLAQMIRSSPYPCASGMTVIKWRRRSVIWRGGRKYKRR